jgi:hypothetical protein
LTDNRPIATFEFDPLNPAQYFACCGLLELASAGTPDVLAAFDHDPQQPRKARFVLYGLTPETVKTTLESLKKAKATAIGESNGEAPIKIEIADLPKFVLDWWLAPDRSRKSRFKLWAGQQTTLKLVEDMLSMDWGELDTHFLDFRLPMSGRFGIDPRSSWNTLDFGSSLNIQAPDPYTYPVTEMLAAIGLQGFRPSKTKEGFSYQLWTQPLPLIPARAAASLAISEFSGSSFVFQVEKRSGSFRCFTFARPQ